MDTPMRTLAIGDIHGCYQALKKLAEIVEFQPDDLLITLGDYVDRGPETPAVLDWLIHYPYPERLITLRGNHEVMMLDARHGPGPFQEWMEGGGDKVLAAYAPFNDPGRLIDIPDSHWQFLEGTRRYYETERRFFVHANVFPELPLAEQPDFMLFWEQFRDPRPHESGKVMVCGHTSQKSGVPRSVGHAACIDTFAFGGGWLTCLDVDTGLYWQASTKGKIRTDWLDLDP